MSAFDALLARQDEQERELHRLRVENARLKHVGEELIKMLKRAQDAEAEVARLKDLHRLGWASTTCPVCDEVITKQAPDARIAALEAERDAFKHTKCFNCGMLPQINACRG